jgi:biopolymer transport protein ExbD
MLRAGSLVVLLIGFSAAVQFCSAQDVHIPLPTAVPQAQDQHFGVPRPNPTASGLGDMPGVPTDDVQRQQAIAANLQRQIEIRRDTDKMLQLTVELKDYLDKAGHAVLSLEAIKKAEQIEKLARSVKSKMKVSY